MLLLSPELAQALSSAACAIPKEPLTTPEAVERLRLAAVESDNLRCVAELGKAVLDEQGFVQFRGLRPEYASRLFPALGSLMGTLFIDPVEQSAIIGAHVRPNEMLMGNQLRHLPLHTDYSMLSQPPRLTMSVCLDPDPTPGWGAVQVADIEAMCFGVDSELDIYRFSTVSLPFAARNAQDQVDLVESPIITTAAHNGRILVRYHRSRIRQGFRAQKREPTPEQAATMVAFERRAAEYAQTLNPEAGDIAVIDNHRTVHARTRCSIRVDANGVTHGRSMQFLFAY